MLSVFSCFMQMQDHFFTVYRNMYSRQQTMRNPNFFLIPFVFLVVVATIWAYISDILQTHPKSFCMAIGFLFSYLAIRAMVQTVCREPFKLYYNVLSPLFLCCAHSLFAYVVQPIVAEGVLVMGYLILNGILWTNIVTTLIPEFCYYLGVKAFSIGSSLPLTQANGTD